MKHWRITLLLILIVASSVNAKTVLPGRVLIPAGQFRPLFGLDKLQDSFEIVSFYIDTTPVTYRKFNQFINKNPEWKKGKVFPLYVDSNYLSVWKINDAPITNVSWYSALAYCESQGGRLPSTLEWEYVAAANEREANALKDPEFNKKIIEWYNRPTAKPETRMVGKGKPNFYKVYDLHGLVWEWTSDFNTFFVASDNRADGDKSKEMFCGSGAINAKDKDNYPAFMRYAFRSSLQARYSTSNLGFRCAYESEKK